MAYQFEYGHKRTANTRRYTGKDNGRSDNVSGCAIPLHRECMTNKRQLHSTLHKTQSCTVFSIRAYCNAPKVIHRNMSECEYRKLFPYIHFYTTTTEQPAAVKLKLRHKMLKLQTKYFNKYELKCLLLLHGIQKLYNYAV